MKRTPFLRFCGVCTAMMMSAALLLCSGCYKGDGTETPPSQHIGLPEADPNAAYKESVTTNVAVDPNAKKDYPFAFDLNSVAEPAQDILLVMIYDNYENGRTQTVNFYDKKGNVYRYRQPLDTASENWFAALQTYYPTASPVNIMSTEEQKTLWYLSSQIQTYAASDIGSQKTGGDILGVRTLYLMDSSGQPVMLARYDDTVMYRSHAEVTAFANWFRYFFHGTYVFPAV